MIICILCVVWLNLLCCFYFYIGLFIGLFIFVVVLIGMLYVVMLQLENWFYYDVLYGFVEGILQLFSVQIVVVEEVIQGNLWLLVVCLVFVLGEIMCIMFVDLGFGELEFWVIFVDLIVLWVKGDMMVYGISGILLLCQWIDYVYCFLLLGDSGRLYSELVVFWMWVVVFGGIVLWVMMCLKWWLNNVLQNYCWLYVMLGWGLLVGMLFFFVIGLIWL